MPATGGERRNLEIINERLVTLGGTPQVESVTVIPAMAMALRNIYRSSMCQEAQPHIPEEHSLGQRRGDRLA